MKDFEEFKEPLHRLCNKCGKCNGRVLATIWEKVPESCELEGWLFLQKEAIKQKVRKQKEKLLILEIKLKQASSKEVKQIKKDIKQAEKIIKTYSKYGSENW